MPSLRLHFGLPRLKGRLPEYAKAFNLVEVPCEPAPPTAKHLGRLKREAPEGFEFALVAGKALAELGSSSPDAALVEATRQAAVALGARFIVLRTPASAGPSARTRAKLARMKELLDGAAGGIAWEPRGMWTDEEVVEVAGELGVTLVRDLAEQDPAPGPLVYTRLLALGRNARLGSGAIERVSERLAEAEEAYIVIEGDGGAGIAKRLRASLVELREDDAAGEGGEGDDDEPDDG
ncbi:MAG TPA: DUF72 domain-containing protein, partial [Polyangiaceae bacterium]|nr:DUF72 domain-containing protein [Polyangiaceae bacterium]